jgi:nicotinamide-nucleotide amidase
MRIKLLLTGNELMNGDIVDSNSSMIAQRFAAHGWRIIEKRTIGDDRALLIATLGEMARDCDVLLVNGGLGPTVDDLTAEALAAAAGVAIVEQPQALAHLEQWSTQRGLVLNAANRKQALLPAGCDILPNPVGTAVGFALDLHGCRIYCTPGVPRELERMVDDSIVPELTRRFGAGRTRLVRFGLFGIGESALQQLISDNIPDWPASVELGFRASFPVLELKLASHGEAGERAVEALLPRLEPLLTEFRVDGGSLGACVVELLKQRGLRITTAESCTGGLIASQITQVAGASNVFDAGFVTYSNAMKQALLGVDADILEREGAVSETVVLQMARGALERSGADHAIAISGIAGPSGGSDEKPVGTVWFAWGGRDDLRSACFAFGDHNKRQWIQQYSAAVALDLTRRHLLGIDAPPNYLRARRVR